MKVNLEKWKDELKERQFLAACLDRLNSDVYQVIEIKDVIPFIQSLLVEACKEQREICADIARPRPMLEYPQLRGSTVNKEEIRNAPLPKGVEQ